MPTSRSCLSDKGPAAPTLRFADSSALPVSALIRRLAATASSIAAAYRSVSASELDRLEALTGRDRCCGRGDGCALLAPETGRGDGCGECASTERQSRGNCLTRVPVGKQTTHMCLRSSPACNFGIGFISVR